MQNRKGMKKLAVVTGATKGIGRAIAEKFAAEGFDIAMTSRSAEDLEAAKTEIEGSFAINCLVFRADLSLKTEAEAFASFVKEQQKELAVLVNNTGTFVQGTLMTEPDGSLEHQINTNVYSAYWLTRALFEPLKNSSAAHVFNISSIAGLQAYPGSGSYSVSKFALLGFSKSLREELKPYKIKVTSVLPGATYTSSWEGVNLPESRFMKAQDVADIVFASYKLSPSAVVEDIVMRPTEGDI